MWTQKFCLICIYILRNYAFQISNEALFLAFLQPVANRLKSFILPSNRMGKTSSASTFRKYGSNMTPISSKRLLKYDSKISKGRLQKNVQRIIKALKVQYSTTSYLRHKS